MMFVVLCPRAPDDSTSSDSGFKASQKMGPWLEVSSDRLGKSGIELVTPGYKASKLSTTPRQLESQQVDFKSHINVPI